MQHEAPRGDCWGLGKQPLTGMAFSLFFQGKVGGISFSSFQRNRFYSAVKKFVVPVCACNVSQQQEMSEWIQLGRLCLQHTNISDSFSHLSKSTEVREIILGNWWSVPAFLNLSSRWRKGRMLDVLPLGDTQGCWWHRHYFPCMLITQELTKLSVVFHEVF